MSHYHTVGHWDAVFDDVLPGAGPGSTAAQAALHRSVRAVMAAAPRGPLLDVACGSGAFLRGTPWPGARIGVDFSARALAAAKDRDCTWLRADATRLPLRSASVAAATCLMSLWSVPDPPSLLRELRRVLCRSGMLAIQIWGPAAECRLITMGAVAIAETVPALVRPADVIGPFDIAPETVAALAATAGFPAPMSFTTHAHLRPGADLPGYWEEFAALAPTAWAAYLRASRAERSAIDARACALLRREDDRGGGQRLMWHVGAMSVPH